MKTHPAAQTFGSLDVELRVPWLEAKGDPLSRLATVIDWEGFRPLLVPALAKPAKGPGGRPAHDPVKLFKLLVVQRYYNWSDAPTESQVSDRLSFQKFAGWTVADKEPAANPLWDCREALVRADVCEQLFEQFAQQLPAQGLLAQAGQLVAASFVDVPRQRNPRAENAAIQAGGVPEAWAETPAKPPRRTWPRTGRSRTPRGITVTRTLCQRTPKASCSNAPPSPLPVCLTRRSWRSWWQPRTAKSMPTAPIAAPKPKRCGRRNQ